MENGAGNKRWKRFLRRFVPRETLRLKSLDWHRRAAGKLRIAHAKIAGRILRYTFVAGVSGMRHMADGMHSHAALSEQQGKSQQKSVNGTAHAGYSIHFPPSPKPGFRLAGSNSK